MRRVFSGLVLLILLVDTLTLAVNIQPVRAIGTITIRADGSIDPPTAPINRNGDQYVLTGTIVVDDNLDGLVIERNDIVLDGAGYILQGLNTPLWIPTIGIVLSERSNITVKNFKLSNFGNTIYLNSSSNITIQGIVNSAGGSWGGPYDEGASVTLEASSNNTITECNLWGMRGGLSLVNGSSDANIISNNIINGAYVGLSITGSFNTVNQNHIGSFQYQTAFELSGSNNSVIENMVGWMSLSGANNTLVGNNIDRLYLDSSLGGNKLYHNNLPDWLLRMVSPNVWDDGYPSGGNHWSDYNGVDLYSGPYQNESGSDGIGDTPYMIDLKNIDHYPLMTEFPPPSNSVAPVANFLYSFRTPMASDIVTFNASISKNGWNATHTPIAISTYSWDFGDGNVTSGNNSTIIHSYAYAGTFNVTLTISDSENMTSTCSQTILVIMPTSISVSTSATSSLIGYIVSINGTLSDIHGNAIGNEPVLLYYTFPAVSSLFLITSTATGNDGQYDAQWIPTATGTFYIVAEWTGNTTYSAASNNVTMSCIATTNQYVFSVESNSTISGLAFNATSQELSFTASGPSSTAGYAKVTIAKSLVSNITNIRVYLDNNQRAYSIVSTDDSWLLMFNYTHSTHTVRVELSTSVIPEFSNNLILFLLVTLALAALVLVAEKRKLVKLHSNRRTLGVQKARALTR